MSTPLFGNVIEDNDQTRARLAHLEEIKNLVGNAYPNKFQRTNITGSDEGEDTITALGDAETLKRIVGDEAFSEAFTLLMSKVKAGERPTPEELAPVNVRLNEINVRVSGRLATPPRVMGKVAFVHLSDGRERLQIYVRKQDAVAVSNDTGRAVEEFESGWKLFQLLDHGDFAGVEGFLFVTKTGELSVHVRQLQFLSKALLPMPDKLHGISDPEIRQRQRYADLIASSLKVETGDEPTEARELSTREVFERRSALITQMRRYLDDHGYIEVETPMLSPIASGAAAKPFETFHKALGIPLYLRIAPELYLKRLLVGGFERVYELNRNFRNEGISTRHNPEFTMLEFYTAYKDVNWMMDFCEEMLRTTIKKIADSSVVRYDTLVDVKTKLRYDPSTKLISYTRTPPYPLMLELDFSAPFKRLSMKEAVIEYLPDDFKQLKLDGKEFNNSWLNDPRLLYMLLVVVESAALSGGFPPKQLRLEDKIAEQRKVELSKLINDNWQYTVEEAKVNPDMFPSDGEDTQVARNIEALFVYIAENSLMLPTFITDFPKSISPLSKASPENPAIAERFELYVAGMEVANGFSELNDPAEQLERFEDQTRQRERGDEEAMQMDLDYVRALSYGMPPAAGIGIGIDRLTMLLTNRRSIRDVILFPHMRPKARAEEAEEQEKTEASGEEPEKS